MGRVCSMQGKKMCILVYTGIWSELQKERDHQEDLDVVQGIILKYIPKKSSVALGFIHVAQDKDQWQALVSTAMYFWDP